MAKGNITSPNTWTTGTVVEASWCQDVQDTVNAAFTDNTSHKGIHIDGYGLNTVSPAQGLTVKQGSQADTPIIQCKDVAGNLKFLFDHNGYPGGNDITVFNECWPVAINVAGNPFIGALTNYAQWSGEGSGSMAIDSNNPTSIYPFAYMAPSTSGAGNSVYVYQSQPLGVSHDNMSLVCEADVSAYTLTGVTNNFGMSFNWTYPNLATSTDALYFSNQSDGHWYIKSTVGGVGNSTQLSNTPGTYDKLRIEYHGVNSPFGKMARFFLNGSLVGSFSGSSVPASNNTPFITFGQTLSTGSPNGAGGLKVGPIRLIFNRSALSINAL